MFKFIKMIIGWDIGIKNLSYCILKELINDEKPDSLENYQDCFMLNDRVFQIVDWNLINIADNMDAIDEHNKVILINRKKPLCKYEIAHNKPCGKPANYCLEELENNNYEGYCSSHFRRTVHRRLPIVDKACNCYYQEDGITCDKKAVCISKKNHYIGYCLNHKKELMKNKIISEDDMAKISTIKKTTHMDLTTMGNTLFNELDKYPSTLTAETVLLENQPVLKNPTMKSVQMFVYSYYIMKGLRVDESAINSIKCYSASKKLDVIKLFPGNVAHEQKSAVENLKSKYSKNKKLSVLMTDYLLKDVCKWYPMFKDSKKKDDLCDAFLMTLHYLTK